MKLYDWQIDMINRWKQYPGPVVHMGLELGMRGFGKFNMMIDGKRIRCSVEAISGYDYSNPENDPIFLVGIAPYIVGRNYYMATNYHVNLATKSVKDVTEAMKISTTPGRQMKLNRHEQKRLVYRCKKAIRNCKALQ